MRIILDNWLYDSFRTNQLHPCIRAGNVRRINTAAVPAYEFAVVAEEIDAVRAGLEGDGDLPRVARAVGGHVGPLLGREQFANVGGAAIGAAVEHPKDAALIRARPLGKGDDYVQPLAVQGGFHHGRGQQFFAPEKMRQQKRRLVLLITLRLRMPFPNAMAGVGAQV